MKNRRHTPEQIVRKLREADRLLGEGVEPPEVMKALEVGRGDVSPVARAVRWDEDRHANTRPRDAQPRLLLCRPRSQRDRRCCASWGPAWSRSKSVAERGRRDVRWFVEAEARALGQLPVPGERVWAVGKVSRRRRRRMLCVASERPAGELPNREASVGRVGE
jgi:hypothetical protein